MTEREPTWAPDSVLITGGSGYLGRALVRECLKRGSRRVCVYSRDEAKHAAMREEISDERVRYLLGDVRDVERLTWALQSVSYVVHAAALKRVETGEMDTEELVKTNVDGTRHVIHAARRSGVLQAVLVSTDKAVEPVNAYGSSKHLAEKLWAGAQAARGGRGPCFTTVRYGNVAGSTGSVIPTWRLALEAGRELKVTDPRATRFWMTRQQAVDLVLEGCQSLEPILVPELPAYKLADLLQAMGATAWPGNFVTTELRLGEKLHESLAPGVTSDQARRMSVEELREELAHV